MPRTELTARCPECSRELWRERGGEHVLTTSVVKVRGDAVVVVCPGSRRRGCGAEVPVPWLRVEDGAVAPRRVVVVRRRSLADEGLDTAAEVGSV